MSWKTWLGAGAAIALAACSTGTPPTPDPQPAWPEMQGPATDEAAFRDGQVYPGGNTYRLLAIEELPIVGVTVDSQVSSQPKEEMVDGNLATAWSNGGYRNATAWAAAQLAAATTLGSIGLKTGPSAPGTRYDVQVSDDGASWRTVLSSQTNTSWSLETKALPAGTTGRFVRIFWRNSATSPQPHFSIFELVVHGEAGPAPTPTATPSTAPTTTPTAPPPTGGTGSRLAIASATASSTYTGLSPASAIDGNASTQWANGGYKEAEADLVLAFAATQTFGQVRIKTGALPAGVTYKIDVSGDGSTWQPASGRLTNTTWNLEAKEVSGTGRYLRVRFFNSETAPIARFAVFETEAYGTGGGGGGTTPTPTPQPTATPTPGTGASAYYPDLQAVPPSELYVQQLTNGQLLRFDTRLANVGAGHFQIRAATSGDVTDAYQDILNGSNQIVQRKLIGQFVYHAEHGHTHLDNVNRYELRTGSPTGTLLRVSKKVSFCIEDSLRFNSGGPTSQYPECLPTVMGITRTWADLYTASLPGQEFNVTGLPAGEYYVVILIDPGRSYLEQSRSNNRAWVKIFLDPRAGTVNRTGTGT